MKNLKLKNFNFIFAIIFYFAFCFVSISFADKITQVNDVTLPYTVDFSPAEINFLQNLDSTTLNKIRIIMQLLVTNSTTTQSAVQSLSATLSTQNNQTQSKQNPLLSSPARQSPAFDDNARMDQALREAQRNPPPPVPQSVLNQENLAPGQSAYLGDFVCNQNGGGSFNTGERPRNQGGQVQDELFYAIGNAAKSAGVSLTSLGCFNQRNIAGSNTASQHSTGSACDILPKGQDSQKTAFIVYFLANTGNFNTVGTYAERGFDHSHLGADCGGTWCPYQKGSGIEPWKELAFRTVFQACGQQWSAGQRPGKKWVQDCAKKAVDKFCQKPL